MRSYEVGFAPSTPVQGVFNMTLSKGGPKVLPFRVDMTTADSVEVDLSPLVQNGNIDFVSGFWLDNSDSAEVLTIRVDGTKQALKIPAGSQGYFPTLSPNMPKFFFETAVAPGVEIPVIFYNIPLLPYLWNSDSGGMVVSGDWLTDAELRAAPVPVSYSGFAYTDRSIVNLSGATQQLMAANAARKVLFVQNIAANPMGVNINGGVAAIGTAGTITLSPGASILIDTGAPLAQINIIGTANDDVTAYEG